VSVSVSKEKSQDAVPSVLYDVVVLGAGPYGLSAAAHLCGYGLRVATFGKPISFWRNHMPEGMLLRSYWWATSLSDPEGKYSISRYLQEQGIKPVDPLPAKDFIDYGLWFQKHAVPDLDETYIRLIERLDGQYLVTLEDGRRLMCKTVVLAPGLHYYLYTPDEYAHLPASLVSHSSQHRDVSAFKGKKIAIIGGGQGSLETAALIAEQGTDVVTISRKKLSWLPASDDSTHSWYRNLRTPQAGMGDGWKNLLLEKYPYALHSFPQSRIDNLVDTMHGPAGADWLKPRVLNATTVKENVQVLKTEALHDEKAVLTLSDGERIEVEHIILGTGYRTNVKDLPMLSNHLKDSLQSYHGAPILNSWFESNLSGLFFVGFSSTRSFGPFYRFVVGTDAAARRVSAAVAKHVRLRK
jgi:FAD-dependent urate hydroxylase